MLDMGSHSSLSRRGAALQNSFSDAAVFLSGRILALPALDSGSQPVPDDVVVELVNQLCRTQVVRNLGDAAVEALAQDDYRGRALCQAVGLVQDRRQLASFVHGGLLCRFASGEGLKRHAHRIQLADITAANMTNRKFEPLAGP